MLLHALHAMETCLLHVLAIRVMMRRADRIETKVYKRDIIGEHADLGSQVFAPLTRVGFFPERNCNTNRIDPRLLDTYDGTMAMT